VQHSGSHLQTPKHVLKNTNDSMRRNAACVGIDEMFGDDTCGGVWHAVGLKNLGDPVYECAAGDLGRVEHDGVTSFPSSAWERDC
jgi:hypothetical protein